MRHPQVVGFAEHQQFVGAGEIIRQHGFVAIQHATGGLGFVDDKTAAHRVVSVAMKLAVLVRYDQRHGIGVERQVFIDEQHVALPDKRDRVIAIEFQCVGFTQFGDALADQRRIDCVGPFAHQAHDHRAVTAMTDAGCRERAVKPHFNAVHLPQLFAFAQTLNEQRRRAHGADGV